MSKRNQKVDININITVDDSRNNQSSRKENNHSKIRTKLSVPQLAYFFRIMYQLNLINNSNQSDILNFLSSNFETENTSEISFNSLKSKYYSVDPSTRSSVREIIIKMMNHVNHHDT